MTGLSRPAQFDRGDLTTLTMSDVGRDISVARTGQEDNKDSKGLKAVLGPPAHGTEFSQATLPTHTETPTVLQWRENYSTLGMGGVDQKHL